VWVPLFIEAQSHVTIWGVEVCLHLFLTLSVGGREWLASCPFRFTWRNGTAVPFNGRWWAPETVLDALENRGVYFHCQESTHNTSAVQPVVQSLSRFCVAANACTAWNSQRKLEFEVNNRALASLSCMLSKCGTRISERQALWLDCVVDVTRSFLNSVLHGGWGVSHATAALLLSSCPRYLLSGRVDRSQSLCGHLVKRKVLSCVGAGNWKTIPRCLAVA
jgi:hypothetical protein